MDIVLFLVNNSYSQHIKVFNTMNTIIKFFISNVHKKIFQVLTRVGIICYWNTIYIVLCSCRIFLRNLCIWSLYCLSFYLRLPNTSLVSSKLPFCIYYFYSFFLSFLFLDKYANKYIQCYCCGRFYSRKAIKKIP